MTATSNIHIGLSAWATSHVYSLGARVSANGNAYQATTGGTSASTGSGPSTTSSSISDGSVTWKYLSAIDYNTLAAWVSSIPATLTQPVVGNLWNDGPISTSSGVAFLTLTGHTTSPTNTISLQCATGESFRDALNGQSTPLNFNSTKGVSFVLPASGTGGINYFNISDANVIISGLQFQDSNAASGSTIIQMNGTGSVIAGCLFDGFGQPSGAEMISFGGGSGTVTLRNSLIIDRGTPSSFTNTIASNTATFKVANCTIIGINNPANTLGLNLNGTSGTMTVTNTIVMGYTSANSVTATNGGSATATYSLFSNSGTGFGATNGTGNIFSAAIANQFVNAASDFRLKTGSAAIDAGTVDTTDIPTSTDIANTTRPSGSKWDIGAWELVQAAPSVSLTGIGMTSATGNMSANLPTKTLSGIGMFASIGTILTQVLQTVSSMYTFVDGQIPNAAQLNGNWANCIDKTTSTPQQMAASLTVGGALQGQNLFTPGLLSVSGGIILGASQFSTSGAYTVGSNDFFVSINKTVPSATTVVLPGAPAVGRLYIIADGAGVAATYPITIQGSNNINQFTSWLINSNYGIVMLAFNGVSWNVVGNVGPFDGTMKTSAGSSRNSNTVTGSGSVAIGANNVSSGTNTIALGAVNTATGNQAVAMGNNNIAGSGSVSLGSFATDRGRLGQFSFANGRLAATGDSQYGLTTLRKTIAASGSGRLTVDAAAASATNTMNLVNNSSYGFGRIVVNCFDSINTKAAMFYVDGLLVVRGASAATTALIGTPTITLPQVSSSLSALTTSSLTVTADTTNGGVNITLANGTAASLDVVAAVPSAELL